MKRYFWLLICLFLGACTTGESTATPVAQVVTSTPSLTATLPENAIPTVDPIPTIITPTLTLAATITPTNTPEPTATAIPISPPTGRIYFLWDPQELSLSGVDSPAQNLYLATLDEASPIWNIEAVLEGLIGWPAVVLSPDKTRLALSPLEDMNQDGFVSQGGYNRGFDAPNLYSFDLITKALVPITTSFPNIRQREIYWLLDGQALLLGQNHTISLVSPVDQIRQMGPAFSVYIEWSQFSPNAQMILINPISGDLTGLDVPTGETLFTLEGIGGSGLNGAWSLDSKWMILHHAPSPEFFFMSGETFALNSVIAGGSIGLMAWSPTGSTLLLHEYTDTYSRLLLMNPNDLAIEPLVEMPSDSTLSYLGWSPDGTQILYLLKQDLIGSLMTVDLSTREQQTIWQSEAVGRFNFLGWSPDNEWLLFLAGRSSFYGPGDEAVVSVLHRRGYIVFELIETSGSPDPYGFFWLP